MNEFSKVQSIDRKRASFAYECITEVINKHMKVEKAYKSYVKKMPSLIKTNGLGQTLAFYFSKSSKENNESAYKLIYNHIKRYLKENQVINNDHKELMQFIIELDTLNYRHISMEVLAFLNWLRRFADGRIEGEETND